MKPSPRFSVLLCLLALGVPAGHAVTASEKPKRPPQLEATLEPVHGLWSLNAGTGTNTASLKGASIAAKVDGAWIHAADYPRPLIAQTMKSDDTGPAELWTVTYSGGLDRPDLIFTLRLSASRTQAFVQVTVRNGTAHGIDVEDIRPLEIGSPNGISLGGTPDQDRVLSDSFSEDRPAMKIYDLGAAPGGLHRGVGSQLIFNRKSGLSFFAGALTSDKFLTILRAHVTGTESQPEITSYEIDNAGTTELTEQYSLKGAPDADRAELRLTVKPGEELRSERLLLSFDSDYHRQLESYARMIRDLHHARVSAPTPMGWWSWTAYYAKLDEATALVNAGWLSENLKSFGYNFFHIDEGYAAGRGDYLTPDQTLFPNGMEALESKIAGMGLTPAIWTAPFEVSSRSWVFANHPEWLVKNAAGEPIELTGSSAPNPGALYVLDITNPDAQVYLASTYSTMARQWGIRYFKLDFMEDSSIEGVHYRPNTSALEAQRIGLQIIRDAVGNDVYLDKDGSEMLNPVGLVDMGRISQDTGHNFEALKAAATGIAARYYMNHNFFVADPDAFMVTTGQGDNSLSLEEAKVSIALAAVSGGMFEIGDKLPDFDLQPDRLALVENQTLIGMARGGRASVPIDLMSYAPEEGQPSIFYLEAGGKNSGGILTVFNWTDNKRTQTILREDLGLASNGKYSFEDVWTGKKQNCTGCVPKIDLPPHSVVIYRIAGAS